MSHDELMVQLKDIHLASPPLWWPPAFGYYLAVFAALIIIALGVLVYRHLRRARMSKTLLRELIAIEEEFSATKDSAKLQASLSALFRRLAFSVDETLSRAIDLDETLPTLSRISPDENRMHVIIDLLKVDRYRKHPAVDGALLISLAREQLKRCRI